MQCGLVGLPNVGKSTIFRAISSAPAEVANYPFCTIEPNVGIASVVDERLQHLASAFASAKTIPAVVKFFDIAGLVAGASAGEGLGNKFLAHIRECNAIGHVLRCFEDSDVIHVSDTIDPLADFETINTELILADIEVVERRMTATKKNTRVNDAKKAQSAQQELALLTEVARRLSAGTHPRYDDLGDEGMHLVERELTLLSAKRQIIICNVDERTLHGANKYVDIITKAYGERLHIVTLCGKLEAELCEIDDVEERALFLKECGVENSGLVQLVQHAYRTLNLCTFFTAGKAEARAWTITCGDTIAVSAGKIHTDFEKGFIKAEVYSYEDFRHYGSETALRQAGKIRTEGREYITQDGDVVFIHAH